MRVETTTQAKFYLRMAQTLCKPQYIKAVIDFFMRNDTGCPIAEYLSIALTYMQYGKCDKAREMISDVLSFLDEGCGEKNKYNNDKEVNDKKGLEVRDDGGAGVHEE